jgi:ATP-dependent DNA helicase RecQ
MALDQSFDRVRDEDEASVEVENIYDEELFSVLKDLRKTIAKEKKLPPYVIFSDPSLEEMATRYPCTMDELTNIPGISQGKASKYGRPFIDLIAAYVKENEIERPTDLVIKSVANKSMLKVSIIQNIDKKIGLDDIARSKGMSRDDLLHEVENIVFSGTKLNLSYYINDLLEEDVQDEIIEYFRGTESDSLEEAMKEFDGSYSREELQLMRIQFFSEYAN